MNKKIHIALVGGQTMPVYQGIIEMSPDAIVLICSESTKNQADTIAQEYPGITSVRQLPPVDMLQIMEKTQQILDEVAADEVTINVTSGTKSWALAFTMLTQGRENCQIVYIDQNGMFYNYTRRQQWQFQSTLSMEQLMRFNGQYPKTHTLLSEYTDEDTKELRKIKTIRHKHPVTFNELTILSNSKQWKAALDHSDEGTFEARDRVSYIQWNKEDHWVDIFIQGRKFCSNESLESPHIINLVFNTGWFEYEVAKMISQWQYAHEVWMNVVYPYRGGNAKNEIDVIVNTGGKLLMVECKTQIQDNTNIDKFRSAVKNYGGMGCKALFITESRMKEAAKEKCADNQILSFSIQDYEKETDAQRALFALLDKEIININAK